MEYVGRISNLITTVHQFYNDINPATLSGAIDIVVVKQQNGELACSPFHVRFGKLSLLMPQEKKVLLSFRLFFFYSLFGVGPLFVFPIVI